MKIWTLNEFLTECEELSRNPYSYDFDRMPIGECNGHRVRCDQGSEAAVVIDGVVINMGVINERYPKGHTSFRVGNETMTGLEYVRYRLLKGTDKMRIVNTYYTSETCRRVRVFKRADLSHWQIYGSVRFITEEVDERGNRYAVLHHDGGETSTFPTPEWRVQVETFADIW